MKWFKRLFTLILTFLMILSLSVTAFATTGKVTKELEYRNIKVSLDGTVLDLKDAVGNPVEPFMFNGTNYLPVRALAETLGLNVSWDGKTSTVVLTSSKNPKNEIQTATNTADKKPAGKVQREIEYRNIKVSLDGEMLNLKDSAGNPVEPFMLDGSNYLPVRALSEALGLDVAWDSSTNTIKLTTAKTYKVIRVIDGDTIVVDYNGVEETVRLIGVDTPESVHPDKSKNTEAGFAASEFTTVYLTGKQVRLEFDVQQRDQYGRLLAYVYCEREMFNKKLLMTGYANIATYPPNVKYVDEFTEIVQNRDPSIPSGEYNDGYMKMPKVVYNTPASTNGMESAFLYVAGTVKLTGKAEDYDYAVITTENGNVAIINAFNQNGFNSIKSGDNVNIGFMYLGYSDVLDMAAGTYMETLSELKVNQTTDTSDKNEIHGIPANTIVYVSNRSHTIHSVSDCGGMKNYTEMTIESADAKGYKYCPNCW